MGRLDSALVVVTADHGEEFMDHGMLGHTKTLYDEVLRVPLLIRFPAGIGRSEPTPVALLDVMPTILRTLDLETPEGMEGTALTPMRVV